MKDEALKLALDALHGLYDGQSNVARKAIKEALAQPEQELVAWMRPSEEGYDSAFRDHSTVMACTGNPWTGWVPLYTAPQRPWVGLTDEQRRVCVQSPFTEENYRAIEVKLKENNT